jgi:predicted alpha/beta hydrolase family esterase
MDVLFFHGAGDDAASEDAPLAESLARHLGDDVRVIAPPLPQPGNPTYESWGPVIGTAIADAEPPVALVGHSFGGYMLLRYLAEERPDVEVTAVAIIAAPIPEGDDDWTFAGFELPDDFPAGLPDAPVFLYASEDDEWVPFAHRDLWAAAIPGSTTRTTTGGHQLGEELAVVADDLRTASSAVE